MPTWPSPGRRRDRRAGAGRGDRRRPMQTRTRLVRQGDADLPVRPDDQARAVEPTRGRHPRRRACRAATSRRRRRRRASTAARRSSAPAARRPRRRRPCRSPAAARRGAAGRAGPARPRAICSWRACSAATIRAISPLIDEQQAVLLARSSTRSTAWRPRASRRRCCWLTLRLGEQLAVPLHGARGRS